MFLKKINDSWSQALSESNIEPILKNIDAFLMAEEKMEKATFPAKEEMENAIFPAKENIFRSFDSTHFEDVKVVIIGQDPYHGKGQANGLAFSVNDGVEKPPSLRNILKKVYDIENSALTSKSGNLEPWAKQGVLLLNSILTVNKKEPASHKNAGWEKFTDKVIETISTKKENIVFVLWGKFAHKKEILIAKDRGHLILKSSHPSPLSVTKESNDYPSFKNCKHFTEIDNFLAENHLGEINW